MKKILFSFLLMVVGLSALTAAPKKSVDVWKNELEEKFGKINWVFPDNLKKATSVTEDKVCYIDKSSYEATKTIIDPIARKKGTIQTKEFTIVEIGNKVATKAFSELAKNEVFITYEGEKTNIAHLWMLVSNTTYKKALKKNGNSYSCDSNYINVVCKYEGWSASYNDGTPVDTGSVKNSIFQGKTMYYQAPGSAYHTLVNTGTGDFSIMINNFDDLSISEIKLKYIGYSDSGVPFIENLVNAAFTKN